VLSKPTRGIRHVQKGFIFFFSMPRRAVLVGRWRLHHLVIIIIATPTTTRNVSQIRVNVPDTQKRLCYNNVPRRSVANRTVYICIIFYIRVQKRTVVSDLYHFVFLPFLLLPRSLHLSLSFRFFYFSCTAYTVNIIIYRRRYARTTHSPDARTSAVDPADAPTIITLTQKRARH